MTKRYFMEENRAKPGVISEELRNALGISKKSLPIWIHRMRILGYPPGWLKKADMTNTTIDFINEDDDREEGQIDSVERKTYNTDSFHEYPGFNAPVPVGVRDDYENLGMPPMQEFQQLNYAKQTVQALQPVPHRARFTEVKTKDENEESDSSSQLSDTDRIPEQSTSTVNISSESGSVRIISDLEKADASDSSESDDVLILDVEKRVLCSKTDKTPSVLLSPVLDQSISDTDTKKADHTISNEQTEQQSENKSTDQTATIDLVESNCQTNSDDLIDQQINAKKDKCQTEDNLKDASNQLSKVDVNQNVDQMNQAEEESSSKMTLVSMGAPVPASLNGEKPPLENFAVGMGDLVYFENLPTSTGMFNKMRKIIKKVRKKLSSPSTKSNISTTSINTSSSSQSNQNAE